MTRKTQNILVICLIVMFFMVFNPVSCVMYGWMQADKVEEKLLKESYCRSVAEVLAYSCQSLGTNSFFWVDKSLFPLEMAELARPHRGQVFPDGGNVVFGGGFTGFVYSLSLNREMSTSETNVWDLSFRAAHKNPDKYTEYPILVKTLKLAKDFHPKIVTNELGRISEIIL